MSEPVPAEAFAERVKQAIGPLHAHYANGPAEIRRIAVCSGGGPRDFPEAAAKGCDAFVTGDMFEPVEMWSRELGVHFLGRRTLRNRGIRGSGPGRTDFSRDGLQRGVRGLADERLTVGAAGFDHAHGLSGGRRSER